MSDSSTSTTGFVWSVEGGGAISVSGLYTAPSASQETPATITATKGGKTGTATVLSVFEPATIEAKANISGKVGGSTTAFTTMFTATNSSAEDYSFVVSPTSAGTISAAGVLTLSDNATGTVTVKATHKTQSGVEATVTFTGVVAKAAITGKTVTGKIGGDTVAFADLFTVTNSSATNYNFVENPSGMTTSINTDTGLVTLSDNATGDVTITATHKTQTGVSATGTISGVVPKATITGESLTGKVGGDVIPFADMFTVTNSAGGDYDFVVTPTEAGTVSAAGILTLADTATGSVSVVATHKTKPLVTATCEFTGVTPKPKTVTSVVIQPTEVPALVYGETVQFSGTVGYSDGSSDTDLLFVAPIGFGQIGGKSGLYTAPSRTIETPFTIEVWAASDPTSKAYATIAGVKAA